MSEHENLTPRDFQIAFTGLDDAIYRLKSLSLPGAQIQADKFGTHSNELHNIAGNTVTYEELSFTFIVDADLKNWGKIYEWMHSITSQNGRETEDATVVLLDMSGNPTGKTIRFQECFPTVLSSVEMSPDSEDNTVVASASFVYDSWGFEEPDLGE